MNIKTGSNENYFWIKTLSDSKNLGDFITSFSRSILSKNLVVISFHSDSRIPIKEEYERGWEFFNKIAYFKNLNQVELDGRILQQYDPMVHL